MTMVHVHLEDLPDTGPCGYCGVTWCDSCRIFADRVPNDDVGVDALKTHAWRCYGEKNVKMGGVTISRKYYKCTRCTSFGLKRRVCRDTYPNDKVRWHPMNGSILAFCN